MEESYYRDIYTEELKAEICTLSSSAWRSVVGVLDQFGLLGYFRAFVNGSAHFLVCQNGEPIFLVYSHCPLFLGRI
jgi:hypothetical protein